MKPGIRWKGGKEEKWNLDTAREYWEVIRLSSPKVRGKFGFAVIKWSIIVCIGIRRIKGL